MRTSFMKTAAALACVLAATALFAGCSGKPKGFPSVKPCVVTVVDGGTPIEGVEIALIPDQVMSGVVIGGKTDASGACAVNTTFANFSAPGAPEGEFTVTLKKTPVVEDMPDLTPEQMGEMSRGDIDKYYKDRDAKIAAMPKIVPPDLTSMQTSTIKVKVPADKTLSVDLSEYK